MKLIVGLGNPGPRYAQTRHNVGFSVIARLAEKSGIRANTARFDSLFGYGKIAGQLVYLQQPLTYMNRSGPAIKALMQQVGIMPEEILVVIDDLDLPVGKIRIRSGGGSGGHNGLKSIIATLGTEEFPRLRLGIGRPENPHISTEDYVLQRWSKDEAVIVEPALDVAVDAILAFIKDGVTEAANRFNG